MEKKRELTPVIYRYIWFPCTEEYHWKKSDQKDNLFCVNCVCICVYIGGKENVSLFRLTASQRDSKDWQHDVVMRLFETLDWINERNRFLEY